MVTVLTVSTLLLFALAAEWLHAQRRLRIAHLAFGPSGQPRAWAKFAPLLRLVSIAALSWGLSTLLLAEPMVHRLGNKSQPGTLRHLLLVLDVSPSMNLKDAGPQHEVTRRARAKELLESFFQRVPTEFYRTSVVAFYNGAKPVVVDTKDVEVVRNILADLPLQFAFPVGKTDLFAGLAEAARVAHPWEPHSTTIMVVSDGDSVPATGIPKLPPSVAHVVLVGVGDTKSGSFIDGQQSRQDASTLRQVAVRLRGFYHNGNEKHLSTSLLEEISMTGRESQFSQWTRREYALVASAFGSALYACLPLLLNWLGSSWTPGVPRRAQPVRQARPREFAKLVS